jgi:hypothetical protein
MILSVRITKRRPMAEKLEPWTVIVTQLARSRAVTIGVPGQRPVLRAYSAADMEVKAALAAAAPDLANALKSILNRYRLDTPEVGEAIVALAKAGVTL